MDHEDRYLCDSVGPAKLDRSAQSSLRGERSDQEAGIVLYRHPEKKQQAHGGSGSIKSPSLWSRDARPRLDKRDRTQTNTGAETPQDAVSPRDGTNVARGCEAAVFSVSDQLTEAKGAHP